LQAREAQRDQEGDADEGQDEGEHPAPAAALPEDAAERAEQARAHISEAAWALAVRARRPTQLDAIEWAPKKPKVMTASPATMRTIDAAPVSATPAPMIRIITQKTLRRPSRLATAPLTGDETMPTR